MTQAVWLLAAAGAVILCLAGAGEGDTVTYDAPNWSLTVHVRKVESA